MRKIYDYYCEPCDSTFEGLAEEDAKLPCPECANLSERRVTGGHLFHVIQATSNTSKRYKAGYVHNYQKRPAEKIYSAVPRSPSDT